MPTPTTFITARRNKGERPPSGAGLHKQQSTATPPAIFSFTGQAQVSDADEEQAKEDGEIVVANEETGEEETKDHTANFTAETRRSGRVVKKRQDDAFVFGSELDDQVDLHSSHKVDGEANEEEYQYPRSSAPALLSLQSHRGRECKSAKARITFTEAKSEPSSETTFQNPCSSLASPELRRDVLVFQLDDRIYQIMGVIIGQPRTQINLPILADPQSPREEIPWSAEALVQLYITAYNGGQWNTCDLVVDTWIRVFHTIRHRAEKFGDKDEMHMWRTNDVLKRRRCRGKESFENHPPNHYNYLKVEDPKFCEDIHDIDSGLLAELYNNTKPGAGLRLVWADSLALCGVKLEHEISKGQKYGATWHPDLMYDVLCTTLRMVGRKLTLKIEEGAEGAWCKRYHEHSKNGMPCYREKAAEEGPAAHFLPPYNVNRGEKRGRDAVDVNEENDKDKVNAKRARHAHENAEVVDVDAEGESE